MAILCDDSYSVKEQEEGLARWEGEGGAIRPTPYEQVAALFAGLPDLLVAKEVAGVLRLNEKTVFAKAAKGELESLKYGRSRRFLKRSVIEYVCRQSGLLRPTGGDRIQ